MILLLILSAILGIIAFSPLNYYLIGFVFLVPLFIFYDKEKSFWKLIAGTVVFRMLFLLGTVYYTLEPINWTWIIILFLGLPISIFVIKKYAKAWRIDIAIPFLWITFDHLQAHFALVPTYIVTAGNILGSSPFVGIARPFGIISLTAFIAITSGLLASALLAKGKARYKLVLFAIACIGTALTYSQIQLHRTPLAAKTANTVMIASVATDKNFGLSDAYKLERDLAQMHADLIVLPEGMLDESINDDPERWYRELAKTLHTPVIATLQMEREGHRYVSTRVIDAEGSVTGMHDKVRLTFMGEWWPWGRWHPSFVDWIASHDPQIKSYAVLDPDRPYAAGSKNVLTVTIKGMQIKVASLICMEVHYPYDLISYKNAGTQLIITPASNRWVGAGSDQFRYLTNNLRTIESVWTGIPVLLSGVNDDTGTISPDGRATLTATKTGGASYVITTSPMTF